MKGGVGISNEDKDIIYEKIIEAIVEIATMELGHAQPLEQQQHAPNSEKIQDHQAEDEDI